MTGKAFLLLLAAVASSPVSAQTRASLYLFASQPPLLAEFRGEIYRIPPADLESGKGEVSWQTFSSTAIPGSTLFLNTERHFTVRHRLIWRLIEPPTRFAAETKVQQDVMSGYAAQSAVEMECNLAIEHNTKLFGLASNTALSLKIDKAEEDAWQPLAIEQQETQ